MSSERQIEANRINAQKSHGPVTEAGRARSALNSRRHGLLAETVVLEGESSERFTDLLTALNEEFDPQSTTESALIENMATARWREMRLWSIEKAGLEREMVNHAEGTPATRAAQAFRTLCDQTNVLELLNRYDSRFDRHREHRTRCSALAEVHTWHQGLRRGEDLEVFTERRSVAQYVTKCGMGRMDAEQVWHCGTNLADRFERKWVSLISLVVDDQHRQIGESVDRFEVQNDLFRRAV